MKRWSRSVTLRYRYTRCESNKITIGEMKVFLFFHPEVVKWCPLLPSVSFTPACALCDFLCYLHLLAPIISQFGYEFLPWVYLIITSMYFFVNIWSSYTLSIFWPIRNGIAYNIHYWHSFCKTTRGSNPVFQLNNILINF